jgi:hypothetical protein
LTFRPQAAVIAISAWWSQSGVVSSFRVALHGHCIFRPAGSSPVWKAQRLPVTGRIMESLTFPLQEFVDNGQRFPHFPNVGGGQVIPRFDFTVKPGCGSC